MISKEIKTANGEYNLHFYSGEGVTVNFENVMYRNVPFKGTLHFIINQIILTAGFNLINRSDDWQKKTTDFQKENVSEIVKSETFDFIFSNPSILQEAQETWVNNKMKSLARERDELMDKAAQKQKEIEEFWETNRGIFGQ